MDFIDNDLAKFESITEGNVTLNIFDFDGTIFRSPVPNPKVWDKDTYNKLRNEIDHEFPASGGYGWFQTPITLDDKYIDNEFIEYVVDEVRKSMAAPNTATVMLTGRSTAYEGPVKKILNRKRSNFDAYGLKHGGTTMNFKKEFIHEQIKKFKPTKVVMWDDREGHVKRFRQFLNNDMIPINPTLEDYEVNHVTVPEYYIDEKRERELVGILMNNPKFTNGAKRTNNKPQNKNKAHFWSAVINKDEQTKLLNAVGDKIPEGWTLFAHHMTVAFGKPKSDETRNIIENELGQYKELTAVKLGLSDMAMAVEIETNVPSDNNLKHITIAVAPGGKPVMSNKITNWELLDEPIKLRAQIQAK